MAYIGILTTEEDLTPVRVPKDEKACRESIERMLSASLLDLVPTVMPQQYALLVDDEGSMNRKPVNRIATFLYARNAEHVLLGDAAIVRMNPITRDWEPFDDLKECSAALLELMQVILA